MSRPEATPIFESRDESGFMMLSMLQPRALTALAAVVTGSVCGFNAMIGANVDFENHTELTVTKAQELATNMVVGGADFCPVSSDVQAEVDSYFKAEQSVKAGFHGHHLTIKGPDEIWGVKRKMGLTGPACMNRRTGVEITNVADRMLKDSDGKIVKDAESDPVKVKEVFAELKENVPISFHISEKDPLADTFENDDNEAAKLLNLTADQISLFPYTGFLHPDATENVHTLLHQVDLTVGVNTFATECGPKVMEATASYVEDLVEDELFQEYKDFGVKRENIHMSMENLGTATYIVPYQTSEDKLKAVDGLNYSSGLGTCDIAKDATIEVVK